MTKEKVLSILFWFVAILKLAIFGGLSYVEKLSYQKAGVNHHLRYRMTQLLKQFFSQTNITIVIVVCVIIIVIALIIYFRQRSNHNWLTTLVAISPVIWSFLLILDLTLEYFKDLRAYPYFVLGFIVALLLSFIPRIYLWRKFCK